MAKFKKKSGDKNHFFLVCVQSYMEMTGMGPEYNMSPTFAHKFVTY